MLLAILRDGKKCCKGQLTTCFGLDPYVGPFSLMKVVDHQPTSMSAYRWADHGVQKVAVTIEAAREDYGVSIPSALVKQAIQRSARR